MKKFIAVVLLILLLLPSIAIGETLAQGKSRVFDQAELMSDNDIKTLESAIAAMRRQYDMDFVILTSGDAKTDKSQEFADDFYDNNGFGAGEDADGFLFFIDMNNRVATVSTSGQMIRYLTDARLNTLFDAAYPYLSSGEYGKAAQAALSQVTAFLKNGIPEDQYNEDEYGGVSRYQKPMSLTFWEIVIAAAAGLISALILYFSVRHKYLMKGSAYSYDLNSNASVTITGATDVYLRTAVTRTPKASSSSGGGGGGRSSTHHTSSGRSHGGGSSRRF